MNQAHRASLLEFEGASYSSRCLLRYRNEARIRDTIEFGIEKDECMVVNVCYFLMTSYLPVDINSAKSGDMVNIDQSLK